jgi:futalosine hydrolase
MHLLVVAATQQEIPRLISGPRGEHSIEVLVTGVGMVATAAHCAQALARRRYDMAFNFGLGQSSIIVNHSVPQNPALLALPRVCGITVNTVHGSEATIAAVRQRCSPQVESMEGAAFAYACALAAVPYAQVRAVSNIVERRNRDAWRLDVAVSALNDAALRILDHV